MKLAAVPKRFKPIPGYPDYWASGVGEIGSTRKGPFKILRPGKNTGGYHMVGIFAQKNKRKSFLIHRIIGFMFIKNPRNLLEINHIDGNKLNNNIENLEWCTQSENMKHAYRLGLKKKVRANAKLAKKQRIEIKKLYASGLFIQDQLGVLYGVGQTAISYLILNKTWVGL